MNIDHQGKESGRAIGWGSWVGIGVAGLVVGVVVVMLISGSRAEGRIQVAKGRLEAMGYSLDPADMNREVDPAVNGWEFGESAFMGAHDWELIGDWEYLTGTQHPLSSIYDPAYLGVVEPTANDTVAAIKKAGASPSSPNIPLIVRSDYEYEIEQAIEDGEIVAEAVRMPDWAIERDYSRPSMTLFPEFAKFKIWCKAFSFWGRQHFQRGEFEEGLRDFETAYLLGGRVASDRVLIASLVQIACYAITLDQLVMAVGDLSPEDRLLVIPQVQELILSRGKVDLGLAMQGEALYGLDLHEYLDQYIRSMEWYVRYLPIDRKALMAYHWESVTDSAEVMRRFDEDPMGVWAEAEALSHRSYRGNPLEVHVAGEMGLGSYYGAAAAAVIGTEVRDRLALVGLGIWEKEALSGSPVLGLEDVEGEWLDMFNPGGGGFQFRREGDGFVVWSFGMNKVDDGGVIDSKSQLYREDLHFQSVFDDQQIFGRR